MNKLLKKLHRTFVSLGEYAMAAFLDFGVGAGIIAIHAVIYTLASGSMPSVWLGLLMLVVGGALALLPDILDLLWPILREVFLGKKIAGNYNHRESLSHRPLLLLVPAVAVAWLLGGEYWALNAFLCVAWHYVHDMWPLSESGIALAWPLSKRYISWRGFERVDIETPPIDVWMKKHWLRPSIRSCTEIGVGSLMLSAAVGLMVASPWWGALAFALAPLGSLVVWHFHSPRPR